MKSFNQIQPKNRENLKSLKSSVKALFERHFDGFTMEKAKEMYKRSPKGHLKADARTYSFWNNILFQLKKEIDSKKVVTREIDGCECRFTLTDDVWVVQVDYNYDETVTANQTATRLEDCEILAKEVIADMYTY